MLRCEADGVRWWFERNALLGRDSEALALPSLSVRFVSVGSPAAFVRRVREAIKVVESFDSFAAVGARRATVNGSFGAFDHDAGPWEPERFERIAARVAEPGGQGMGLYWRATSARSDRPDGWFWEDAIGLYACTDALGTDDTPGDDLCWEWWLIAAEGMYAGDGLDAASAEWLRLLKAVGGWPEVRWGAVVYDCSKYREPTPFEQYFELQADPRGSDRAARGYYWANLLTEGHLERYGGIERLADACAAVEVACEPVPGRDSAVIRSSQPITAFDDAQLMRMRDALAPVLPDVAYRYYAGPPLRLLKVPGTAFKRVPPDIEIPWFEDDSPLPPNSGTARRLVLDV